MRTRIVPASEVSSKSLLARDFIPNKRGVHPKRNKPMVDAIRRVKEEVDDGFQITVGEVVDLCIAAGAEALLFHPLGWVWQAHLEGFGKGPPRDESIEYLKGKVMDLLLQDEELSLTDRFEVAVSHVKRMLLDLLEWHSTSTQEENEGDMLEEQYKRLCQWAVKGLDDAVSMDWYERHPFRVVGKK